MSHDQGDNLIGLLCGTATALLAHAAQWASASTWAGEALHTVLFGFLGGAAGYLGKHAIERLRRKKRTKNNDQKQP